MNILTELFSSQVRAEIFRLLFDGAQASIYLRDLQRKSGLSIGSIQKEVKHLAELDLITPERDGNRLYYAANTSHPIYRELCHLVEKTSAIPEKIRQILNKIDGIYCAFIFGSIAKGNFKGHSDIDLILIADSGLRSILPKLKPLSDEFGREINPHVYSRSTWAQKMKSKDHFISSVLKEEKIFLIGDEDVLKRMDQERLAKKAHSQ